MRVFYPVSQLPGWLQAAAQWLPLTHAIDIARPLLTGTTPAHLALSVLVLAAYGPAGFIPRYPLARRRLLA